MQFDFRPLFDESISFMSEKGGCNVIHYYPAVHKLAECSIRVFQSKDMVQVQGGVTVESLLRKCLYYMLIGN